MNQNVSTITLHGILGESVGQKIWTLAINSVSEAVHAIEILSKRKLYKFFYDNDKKGVRYKIIVNGREFCPPKNLTINNPKALTSNELTIKRKIKTIDIVPVLQGASDILNIVLGAILIIIGIVLSAFYGTGVPLIIAGVGLLTSGIIGLLTKPPKDEPFREISRGGGSSSYLFSGPENTINEGGPIPVLYGRLIVGSQTIAANYTITYKDASISALTS